MRFIACVAALFAAFNASAEPPQPSRPNSVERAAQRERMMAMRRRVIELEPRRRDTPMRELNISDGEVREIQDLTRKYLVNSMLNISPVVAGCACEEGPLCTDQVYVVATTPTETVGLQLSRIRNAWVVGPVQKWWTRYVSLRGTRSRMDYFEYEKAENELLLEFPYCASEDEDEPATAQTREEKK